MLLLDRKIDEVIILRLPGGRTITLRVKELTNKQTKLGIEAPDYVKIYREEVYLKKLANGDFEDGETSGNK